MKAHIHANNNENKQQTQRSTRKHQYTQQPIMKATTRTNAKMKTTLKAHIKHINANNTSKAKVRTTISMKANATNKKKAHTHNG